MLPETWPAVSARFFWVTDISTLPVRLGIMSARLTETTVPRGEIPRMFLRDCLKDDPPPARRLMGRVDVVGLIRVLDLSSADSTENS